MKYLEDLLI